MRCTSGGMSAVLRMSTVARSAAVVALLATSACEHPAERPTPQTSASPSGRSSLGGSAGGSTGGSAGGSVGGSVGGSAGGSGPAQSSGGTSTGAATSAPSTRGQVDGYPAAARPRTEAGGRAFIEYFFVELNRAYTSGDEGPVAALGSPACEFCSSVTVELREYAKSGWRYESDPVSLAHIDGLDGAPNNQRYYHLSLRQQGANIVDARGIVRDRDVRRAAPTNIAIQWRGSRWWMLSVEEA